MKLLVQTTCILALVYTLLMPGLGMKRRKGQIKGVSLLGNNEKISFTETADGLVVDLPKGVRPNEISLALKIIS